MPLTQPHHLSLQCFPHVFFYPVNFNLLFAPLSYQLKHFPNHITVCSQLLKVTENRFRTSYASVTVPVSFQTFDERQMHQSKNPSYVIIYLHCTVKLEAVSLVPKSLMTLHVYFPAKSAATFLIMSLYSFSSSSWLNSVFFSVISMSFRYLNKGNHT